MTVLVVFGNMMLCNENNSIKKVVSAVGLAVYTQKEYIPDGMKYIRINDEFFDGFTNLVNTKDVARVLEKIDHATYHSASTFIGRNPKLGALNKSLLSTGTKTLLNILANPEICFDVCECGDNALELLIKFNEGNVLWKAPILAYSGDGKCNIDMNGIHYNDFYQLMASVMEVS